MNPAILGLTASGIHYEKMGELPIKPWLNKTGRRLNEAWLAAGRPSLGETSEGLACSGGGVHTRLYKPVDWFSGGLPEVPTQATRFGPNRRSPNLTARYPETRLQ